MQHHWEFRSVKYYTDKQGMYSATPCNVKTVSLCEKTALKRLEWKIEIDITDIVFVTELVLLLLQVKHYKVVFLSFIFASCVRLN